MRLWPQREPPPDLDAIAQSAATAAVAAYRAEQEQAREQMAAKVAEVRLELERAQAGGMMGAPPPLPTNGRGRLYARDYPYNWTVPHAPTYHPGSLVDIRTLRRFAQVYDVLRSMINHLKNEVEAVPLSITARNADDDSDQTKKRIALVEAWMDIDGGLGGVGSTRSEFEKLVIEDLHVVGPAAIHLAPTRGGGVDEAVPIDASTIRPVVDPYGFPEKGNEYEQWVMGLRHRGFARSEMYWRGLYPRTDSPYPDSPTEYLVLTIIAAMAADTWNRSWLTKGTEPGRIIYLPADMTPDNAQFYIDLFLATMEGNIEKRQQVFFMPGGNVSNQNPTRRDQDFEAFMMALERRCSAIMGVHLAAVGLGEGKEYAVTQEHSMEQTSSVGTAKLLLWLQTFYDYLLRRLGYGDLQARYVTAREETAAEKADRVVKLTGVPVWTVNRGLQELGDDPLPDDQGAVLFVPTTYQPIDLALNPPEPMPATAPGGAESSGDKLVVSGQRLVASEGGIQATSHSSLVTSQRAAALQEWERRSMANLQMHGHADIRHKDPALSEVERGEIRTGLRGCETEADIHRLFETWQGEAVEFPPSYHTTAQAHERSLIGRRWAQRRLAAEREA
jgi:hypothetical protein